MEKETKETNETKVSRDCNPASQIKKETERYKFKYLRMNLEQLHKAAEDKSKPVHEIMYIQSLIGSIDKGNYGNYHKIMESVEKATQSKDHDDIY